MNALHAPSSYASERPLKSAHSARDFEAILLNELFSALQDTFKGLPGGHEDQSTKAYNGIAMQALTTVVAQGGGIGLCKLVDGWLKKHEGKSLQRT